MAAGLGNVQFVKDGDRLSGKASAESDFDALDDEDVLGGDAGEELAGLPSLRETKKSNRAGGCQSVLRLFTSNRGEIFERNADRY